MIAFVGKGDKTSGGITEETGDHVGQTKTQPDWLHRVSNPSIDGNAKAVSGPPDDDVHDPDDDADHDSVDGRTRSGVTAKITARRTPPKVPSKS